MPGRKIGEAFIAVSPKPAAGFAGEAQKAGGLFGKTFGFALENAMKLGGLLALGDFFKGAVERGVEAGKVMRLTAAAIKSTGGAAHITAAGVEELSRSLERQTGVDHDIIASGENMILRFTKVRNEVGKGNDIFNQTVKAAANVSAALGLSIPAASKVLGKALQDPLKGMTQLRRVGVILSAGQQQQIKDFVKTGDIMSAQKIILGQLTKSYGGAAAAIRTPGAAARVAFHDLQEDVGKLLLPLLGKVFTGAALVFNKISDLARSPTVAHFGKLLSTGFDQAWSAGIKFVRGVDWSPFIRVVQAVWTVITVDLVPALVGLWKTYGPAVKATLVAAFVAIYATVSALTPTLLAVGAATKAFLGWISANLPAVATFVGILGAYWLGLKAIALYAKLAAAAQWLWDAAMAANPIGVLVIAIAALAAGIVYIATRTTWFQTAWNKSWGAIKTAFHTVYGFLKGDLTGLVLLVLGPIGALAYVGLHWKMIWDGIKTGFFATVRFLRGLLATLVGWILGFFGSIVHGADTAFGWLPIVGKGLHKAAAAFDTFAANVNRSLRGIPDQTVHVYAREIWVPAPGSGGKPRAGALHGVQVMAAGGIVRANAGGTIVRVAEAGKDEAIIPLDGHHGLGGGLVVIIKDSIIASRKQAEDLFVQAYNDAKAHRRIKAA